MKDYEKTVRDLEKACEKNERKKREKARKEEKTTAQHGGEVVRYGGKNK